MTSSVTIKYTIEYTHRPDRGEMRLDNGHYCWGITLLRSSDPDRQQMNKLCQSLKEHLSTTAYVRVVGAESDLDGPNYSEIVLHGYHVTAVHLWLFASNLALEQEVEILSDVVDVSAVDKRFRHKNDCSRWFVSDSEIDSRIQHDVPSIRQFFQQNALDTDNVAARHKKLVG